MGCAKDDWWDPIPHVGPFLTVEWVSQEEHNRVRSGGNCFLLDVSCVHAETYKKLDNVERVFYVYMHTNNCNFSGK